MRQNESLAQIRAHQNRKKPPVFNTRQPDSRRVASNMKKSQKTLSFWRFLAIFAHFCSLEKTAVWGFGHTKNAKNHQFLTLDPRFPWEGCTGHTKTRKKTPVFDTRQPDSRRVASNMKKSQKPLSFWRSTRTFPERGCTGHVFRDYWVALK